MVSWSLIKIPLDGGNAMEDYWMLAVISFISHQILGIWEAFRDVSIDPTFP